MDSERFSMFGVAFQGSQLIQSPAGDNAKVHLRRSWIAAGAVALLALIGIWCWPLPAAAAVLLPGFAFYVGWACYWGFVGVADFLTDLAARDANRGFAWHAGIHLLVERMSVYGPPLAFATVGIAYGILGGGIREFLKYRRLAAEGSR